MDNAANIPKDSLQFHYPTRYNPFDLVGLGPSCLTYVELGAQTASFMFYTGDLKVKHQFHVPKRSMTNE